MAQKPKGTADLLFGDARSWITMRETAEAIFTLYGYQPVETPMFETTDVFVHGIGTSTDVVSKEMFTVLAPAVVDEFKEGRPMKADHRLSLRPEGTAGFVRAAVQNTLVPQGGAPVKAWYAGSMFRAERPQKGRLREFHQIGAECLGSSDPALDAEVITMLMAFFEGLGIERANINLIINSMGDDQCRPAYRDSVADYIRAHSEDLCEECQRRADTNPLRAFDCKNEGCKAVMADAPKISDALCDDCREHYATVKRYLDANGVSYTEDPRLVRGLDYYTRTVFEVQAIDGLGSQNAIGGGGRYDKLVEISGGKPTPGLGFAVGMERIILALNSQGVDLDYGHNTDVYVASVDSSVRDVVVSTTMALRRFGLVTECDYQERSLKSQFKQADKYGACLVVVIGPDELEDGQVTLRNMSTHEEIRCALDDVPETAYQILYTLDEEALYEDAIESLER